jgi:rod shape determining protein RodA
MFRKSLHDTSILFGVALLLVFLSLIMLYSFEVVGGEEKFYFFWRQAIFACFSFGVGFFMFRFSYRSFRLASTPLYLLSIGLLLIVLVLGETVRGTSGWIDFGLFRFQPVEVVKIVLVIFLASFFVQKRIQFGDVSKIVISFVLTLILVGFVLLQPDFGSAVILLAIWAGMLFVSDMKVRYVIVLLFCAAMLSGVSWFFLEDYQKDRILTTIQPQSDAQGSGYNVIQSIIAIGSGGFWGKGIGGGSQSQFLFLPERHTDFMFASLVESLGVFGALFLLTLYGILLYRISKVAMTIRDSFGFLIASGIYSMFLVQIVINVGMNIGLVPVTGIPLPFLSYGGSSLLASFIGLGIVANIAYYKEYYSVEKKSSLLDDIPSS